MINVNAFDATITILSPDDDEQRWKDILGYAATPWITNIDVTDYATGDATELCFTDGETWLGEIVNGKPCLLIELRIIVGKNGQRIPRAYAKRCAMPVEITTIKAHYNRRKDYCLPYTGARMFGSAVRHMQIENAKLINAHQHREFGLEFDKIATGMF